MTLAPIEPELLADLEALAADSGCELLHVDFQGAVLRLVLDRPEGVELAQCEAVSRQASALLDVNDFGPGRYTLEVTSPGLDRELYGPRDYQRFLGRHVRVTWRGAVDGRKRTVVGRLTGYRNEVAAALELEEDGTGTRHDVPLDDLVRARLEPQF
ncbi:MAG: ribosome maturation factor RimP, partial [Thermoanaerobaculia bacterium]